jgi:hypothetical protein
MDTPRFCFLPLINYELLHFGFPLSMEKMAIDLGLGCWFHWTRELEDSRTRV